MAHRPLVAEDAPSYGEDEPAAISDEVRCRQRCEKGIEMAGIDDYLAEGRRLAEAEASRERVNNAPRMDGNSPWASLLNRWILLAIVVGFPLGYMIEKTPEGAFAGAIMLGGAAFILTIIAILFRVTFGSAASGSGALSGWLGGLPQWTLLGGLLGAAAGAGIVIWLDGAAADITAPALRLAPVGAGIGFILRAIALALGALRGKR